MAHSGDGSAVAAGGSDQALAVELQPLFQKLKPGPGLPAEQVFADQRRRLHGATIALVDRDGCDGLRVRSLARAAGVSTSTFYKHFVNADDCLASTYDAVMAAALDRAAAAQRREPDWRGSLRATITRLMEHFAADPRAARLALVDVFAAGPSTRKRIGRVVGELEGLVASSFSAAPRNVTPPRHLVAGMTAGMLRVARTTTLTGRAAELPEFAGELGGWMLTLPSPQVLSLLAPSTRAGQRPRREREPFPAESTATEACPVGDERGRLQRAAVKLAERDGFAKLTAPRLRSEAGVSKRSYEGSYDSVAACYLDGIERFASEAAAGAHSWSEVGRGWETRTCRFVRGVCAQAARGRTRTRLVFQGIFAAGRTGLLRRESMVTSIATTLRATVPGAERPSPISAEASVAAIWHIAQFDVAAGRSRSLPTISPLLSYVALAPIVGPATAAAAIKDEMSSDACI
jgi:AcrR family transcriptional regulator